MSEDCTEQLTAELLPEKKFAALRAQLRLDKGEALLVPVAADKSSFRIVQFDGGRDAKYIVVTRADNKEDPATPLRETLGYARQVKGVELIYDLTDETMQGKARPFECDLTGYKSRVYAILPVQIEEARSRIDLRQGRPHLLVNFLDARREVLQAALPFELRVVAGDIHGYECTDRQGRFDKPLERGTGLIKGALSVRSLLTGKEYGTIGQ